MSEQNFSDISNPTCRVCKCKLIEDENHCYGDGICDDCYEDENEELEDDE